MVRLVTEADQFSGFQLRPGRAGSRVAVFQLRVPELRTETSPGGATRIVENYELRFDEASLVARVETLRRQGLDASLSEEALRALRLEGGSAPAGAGRRLPRPEEVARPRPRRADHGGGGPRHRPAPWRRGSRDPSREPGLRPAERLPCRGASRDQAEPPAREAGKAGRRRGSGQRVSLQRKGSAPLPLELREAPLLVRRKDPIPAPC